METLAKYQNCKGTICVSQNLLIEMGVLIPYLRSNGKIAYPLWDKWIQQRPAALIQKGGNGRVSLFDLNFVPEPFRTSIKIYCFDLSKSITPLERHYTIDEKAKMFYEGFKFSNNGNLSQEKIMIYTINASVLNAVKLLRKDRESMRKRLGNGTRNIWQSLCNDVISFNDVLKTKHNLPKNKRALERFYNKYVNEGYEALVSKKHCNKNSDKKKTFKLMH